MLIISSILLLLSYVIVDQFQGSKRVFSNARLWVAIMSFVILMMVIFHGMR